MEIIWFDETEKIGFSLLNEFGRRNWKVVLWRIFAGAVELNLRIIRWNWLIKTGNIRSRQDKTGKKKVPQPMIFGDRRWLAKNRPREKRTGQGWPRNLSCIQACHRACFLSKKNPPVNLSEISKKYWKPVYRPLDRVSILKAIPVCLSISDRAWKRGTILSACLFRQDKSVWRIHKWATDSIYPIISQFGKKGKRDWF